MSNGTSIESALLLEIAQYQAQLARADGEIKKFKEKLQQQSANFDKILFDKIEKHKLDMRNAKVKVDELRDHFRKKSAELASALYSKVESRQRGSGSGNTGLAALEIARFVDDAQYGLIGIMNNIPGVVMALGGSTGLAGVISIAAVGAMQLYKHFSSSAKEAEKAKERAKELADVMNDLQGRLRSITSEQDRMYAGEVDTYISKIREAASAWDQQKSHIADALRYQQELSAAEASITKAGIRASGASTTNEVERAKSVQAQNNVDRTAEAASLQKAAESAQMSVNSHSARTSEASAALNSLQLELSRVMSDQKKMAEGPGMQSDQARRLREAGGLQLELSALNQMSADRPKGLPADLEAKRKDIATRLDALRATSAEDSAALASGKNLTFDIAGKEAEKDGRGAQISAYARLAAESARLESERKKYVDEIGSIEKKVFDLKLEGTELARQQALLAKQTAAAKAQADAAAAEDAAAVKEAQDRAAKETESAREKAAAKAAELKFATAIAREQARTGRESSPRIDAMRDELRVMQLTDELETTLLMKRKEALALAERTVAAERAAANAIAAQAKAESDRRQLRNRQELAAEIRAEALRAAGKNREADKLERRIRVVNEAERIQKSTNLSEKQAMAIAEYREKQREKLAKNQSSGFYGDQPRKRINAHIEGGREDSERRAAQRIRDSDARRKAAIAARGPTGVDEFWALQRGEVGSMGRNTGRMSPLGERFFGQQAANAAKPEPANAGRNVVAFDQDAMKTLEEIRNSIDQLLK